MEQIEQVRQLLADVEAEIDDLVSERDELREFLLRLEEESIENPHWSAPDELGARRLLPMDAIREEMLTGTRAERYYAKTQIGATTTSSALLHNDVSYKGIFATLTDNVSPEIRRMYSEAQNANFALSVIGLRFRLAPVKDQYGNLLHGYVIPWYGNYGPRAGTKYLEDIWAAPDKIDHCRAEAERLMGRLDRRYMVARMQNSADHFLAQYPHYEPE